MVEVEIHNAAGVAADGASPASLGDQDALDLLMPASDCLGDAALAHPAELSIAGRVVAELDSPMVLALSDLHGPGPSGRWRPPYALDEPGRWRWSPARHSEHMFPYEPDGIKGLNLLLSWFGLRGGIG